MEVILIRHTSVNVPKGTCYGWTDVPVNDTFVSEAAATKSAISHLSFDKAFSSPLTRAKKLAAYCGFTDPIIDNRLKEINMGAWEMQLFDEIKDENLQRWYEDFMHVAPTNGETYQQLYERVSSFLNELKTKPYKRVAVFAHGGVLMCAGIYGGLFTAEDCLKNLVPFGGTEKILI